MKIRDLMEGRSRSRKAASSFDEPEANAAFREALLDFAKRNRGKVLKNNRSSVIFTFPKNPHVKRVRYGFASKGKVPFWIENVDGVSGWGWHEWWRAGTPTDPSNRLDYSVLQSRSPEILLLDIKGLIKALSGQLEKVRAKSLLKIRGLKERPDLKSKGSRGWSTSPNTYGSPTYYEVLGANSPDSKKSVLEWLRGNARGLIPGTYPGTYMTRTEVSLEWNADENAWFVVSRFFYTGG